MAAATETKGTLRGALKHRDLRLLLVGLAISKTGDWLYVIALQVFVFESTRSAAWVAAATILRLTPAGLFAPLGGSLADRFDRRRVMISCDLARVVLMLLLAVVAWRGASPALALVIAFASSTAGSPYLPAAEATTPSIVPESELAAANSALGVIDNLGIFLGPALGGVLLLLGPPALAFGINAVSFFGSAAAVTLMRARSRPAVHRDTGFLSHLAEGLRPLTSSPGAAAICGLVGGAAFLYGLQTVLLVLLSDRQLGAGGQGYGYLLAALGVGGAAAAAVAGRLAGGDRPGMVLTLGVVGQGLPLAALALVHSLGLAIVLLAVQGATGVIVDVTAYTALQRAMPERLLARVFGFLQVMVIASILAGALVASWLAQTAGLDLGLVIPGLAVAALAVLLVPLTRTITILGLRRFEENRGLYQSFSALPIFLGVSRPALELLVRESEPVDVRAGEVVIREGEPADALYVVESGELDVVTGSRAREAHLNRIGAGDYFGEIGILKGVPRTATVRADTATRLYRIGADHFLEAVGASPWLSGFLTGGVTARLARGGTVRRSRPRRTASPKEAMDA